MSSYLSRLNPAERRFVVAVGLLFFIVVNVFWVWPHFSDWGNLQDRLKAAHGKLQTFQTGIARIPDLQARIKQLTSEGAQVPPEDHGTEFLRTITLQANQNGVGLVGSSRSFTTTNQFFLEKAQSINVVARETQLVSFLYGLGSGNSLIRVREIVVRPDPPRHQLNASITLVASYQKAAPAPARTPARTAAASQAIPPGSRRHIAPPTK